MHKTMILGLSLLLPALSFASYEKPTIWSAKWSSLGGTHAVSDGSDSLAFNPAGLVHGNKAEVGINLSPVLSKFKGPITTDDMQEEGENVFTPLAGFLYSRHLNDKLAIGAGIFGVGGNASEFNDIDLGSLFTKKGNLKTDLKIIEASLGVGYKVNKNLSFGAAWRLGYASADFQSVGVVSLGGPAVGAFHLNYENLSDIDLAGFRLGAQYVSDEGDWGMGLSYRSQLSFNLEGDASGQLEVGGSGTVSDLSDSGEVNASSRFPMQASLGFFKKWNKVKTYFQFDWTNYSVNELIKFNGDVNPAFTQTPVPQENRDMYSYKLGLECGCDKGWTWRAGYALSTQVTPDNTARATLASPGIGHVVALGAGKKVSDKWNLDLALERAWRGGDVTDPSVTAGEYESAGYTLHLSGKYMF